LICNKVVYLIGCLLTDEDRKNLADLAAVVESELNTVELIELQKISNSSHGFIRGMNWMISGLASLGSVV